MELFFFLGSFGSKGGHWGDAACLQCGNEAGGYAYGGELSDHGKEEHGSGRTHLAG